MPFVDFLTQGDLKFLIVFILFSGIALFHYTKKIQASKSSDFQTELILRNTKIKHAAFWILCSSLMSLLLGLMHSFYFIGQAGGIAPGMIFNGISNALITPTMGIGLFSICHILHKTLNTQRTQL
jgi:hypothetical protein